MSSFVARGTAHDREEAHDTQQQRPGERAKGAKVHRVEADQYDDGHDQTDQDRLLVVTALGEVAANRLLLAGPWKQEPYRDVQQDTETTHERAQ